jgi:hypothetical protein
MATLLLEALAATASHFVVGLLIAAILFVIAVLIHGESKSVREEILPEPELEDIWAGLRPDRDARVAETDFGPDREAA